MLYSSSGMCGLHTNVVKGNKIALIFFHPQHLLTETGVQLSQLDDNVVLRMIKHFFYAREKNTHLIPPLTSQLNSSDWYESVIHSDWQRLLTVVVVEHFLFLWLCEKNHFNLWTFDRRSDSCVHVCRQVPGWMSGESEHIVRMWW